jgi:hypothetical protein
MVEPPDNLIASNPSRLCRDARPCPMAVTLSSLVSAAYHGEAQHDKPIAGMSTMAWFRYARNGPKSTCKHTGAHTCLSAKRSSATGPDFSDGASATSGCDGRSHAP